MTERDRRIVAERAARAGADVAEAAFRRTLSVETKAGPTDLVTDADRNAERAVVEVIRDAYPDAVVVAEEGVVAEEDVAAGEGVAGSVVPVEDPMGTAWIVDPIDGTNNFVAGSRVWATSVAAIVDGETLAATTLMPAYGDDYALGPDRVTRNGTPVSPSDLDDPATFTVVPLGWWPQDERTEFGRLFSALGDRFGDVRRLGCAQATLAMVASGELDGVVATRQMAPWDTVAGAAMVGRAGGTVTDLDGEPWRHDSSGLVASNGAAHDALLSAAGEAFD